MITGILNEKSEYKNVHEQKVRLGPFKKRWTKSPKIQNILLYFHL